MAEKVKLHVYRTLSVGTIEHFGLVHLSEWPHLDKNNDFLYLGTIEVTPSEEENAKD